LAPCVAAAAAEVVARAEPLEEAEVGVLLDPLPVLETVLEAVKVTPYKRRQYICEFK
jgi:hypothetical protein